MVPKKLYLSPGKTAVILLFHSWHSGVRNPTSILPMWKNSEGTWVPMDMKVMYEVTVRSSV